MYGHLLENRGVKENRAKNRASSGQDYNKLVVFSIFRGKFSSLNKGSPRISTFGITA